MPPLPVIANTWRVTLHWRNAAGQTLHNVMHIRGTALTPALIHAALEAHTTDHMWWGISNNFHVFSVSYLPLDGVSGSTELVTTGAHWTGSTSGDYLPAYAIKIELRTSFRGRDKRGRVLVGPLTEGSVTDGTLTGDAALFPGPAWQAFNDALIANSPSMTMVVASYRHAAAYDVDNIFQTNVPAILRRRQRSLVG